MTVGTSVKWKRGGNPDLTGRTSTEMDVSRHNHISPQNLNNSCLQSSENEDHTLQHGQKGPVPYNALHITVLLSFQTYTHLGLMFFQLTYADDPFTSQICKILNQAYTTVFLSKTVFFYGKTRMLYPLIWRKSKGSNNTSFRLNKINIK